MYIDITSLSKLHCLTSPLYRRSAETFCHLSSLKGYSRLRKTVLRIPLVETVLLVAVKFRSQKSAESFWCTISQARDAENKNMAYLYYLPSAPTDVIYSELVTGWHQLRYFQRPALIRVVHFGRTHWSRTISRFCGLIFYSFSIKTRSTFNPHWLTCSSLRERSLVRNSSSCS